MYDSITVKKDLCMHDLDEFLWSGAKDRWDEADEYTKERVWKRICDWAECCEEVADTWVNDAIWFECDDLFYPEDDDQNDSDSDADQDDDSEDDQDADQDDDSEDDQDDDQDDDASEDDQDDDSEDDHANACVMCGETAEWETSDGGRMCLACVLEAYDITPAKPCCAYCGETLPLADKDTMMGDNGDFYCDENCALRAHGCSRV